MPTPPIPVKLPPIRLPTIDSRAPVSVKVARTWKSIDSKAPHK
jgi:hypothetical protein